jgi:hypothetical protein
MKRRFMKKSQERDSVKLSPRTGGRGADHKSEARDKTIRIRSGLYKKIVKLGTAENDVDDIVSMLYEYWEKSH